MNFTTDVYEATMSQTIREVLDNDQGANERLLSACSTAVLEGSGYSNPADAAEAYDLAVSGKSGDYREFVDAARVYVLEVIDELFPVNEPGLERLLLRSLLDTGNRNLWCDITDGYMPEHGDLTGH